ncbi:type II toxin-antitoxin system HicA family toxin [Campylobacter showae]|uniref:type II toxin-antitoxin system HicA family toxin n=1 Tax=Campylobacter showae TaxID=204 RepID=UPI000F07C35E|nr:type II toxin-antitoxin system HicA family toxin [Campylobacter showae]
MSKRDKLTKELENSPLNVRFETLKGLLEGAGYVASNNGSSHWQFRKSGRETITIPYKRPIKPIYVKMTLKAIKEEK